MLNLVHSEPLQRKCDGTRRREFMQIGALGLAGLTLPGLLRARAAADAPPKRVRSVILLFLDGGASQIETFDPKPQAAAEYREIFGSIETKQPGVRFGSQFPLMAGMADQMSVVRTLTHTDGDHGGASHWMKTGHPWPAEFLGKAPIIPQQSPSFGSIASRYRGSVHPQTGVPAYVRVLGGPRGYPGDDAAWLGGQFNPFRVSPGNYNTNPMLHNMQLNIDRHRLGDRQTLMQALDRLERKIDQTGMMNGMDQFHQQALNVVRGKARQAFDLSLEDPRLREKYGPGLGEELMLARRLCEMGAGFVTLASGGWDHHGGIIPGLKKLCPPLDRVVATYVEDMQQRGQLDDVLLVITGEFGRSPRINAGPGRDHWAGSNCAVLIGGGLKMGQVVGESDAVAGYPKTRPVSPLDFAATLFHVLDMPLDLQYIDPAGRPRYMIEDALPVEELL